MKSFFKKLSFVLAAAMIITLIPAQAAKAEDAKLIKIAFQNTKDYVETFSMKVGATQDFQFYGCLDYKTTGTGWVSSNDAVATVDNKGVVTAVGAGYAEIGYTAKGYDTQFVKLVVTDEYDTFIADLDKIPAANKTFTKIGDSYDFCFVNAQGYTQSKHKCTWMSTNTSVATVDWVGNVTAVGEGTATIVLTIVDKTTGAVAYAVQPLEVTVAVSKLEVKQTAYNQATASFGGKAVTDAQVYYIDEDGVQNPQFFKATVDEKKGITTLSFDELENGKTYVVTSGDESVSFVANVGALETIEFEYSSTPEGGKAQKGIAFAGTNTTFKVTALKDADGKGVKQDGYVIEYVDERIDNGNLVLEGTNNTGDVFVGEVGEKHIVTINVLDGEGNIVKHVDKDIIGAAVPKLELLKSTASLKLGTVNWANLANSTEYKKSSELFVLTPSDLDNYGLSLYVQDSLGNEHTYKAGAIQVGETENLRDIGQFKFEVANADADVCSVNDIGVLEPHKAGRSRVYLYFEYINDDGTVRKEYLTSATLEVKDTIAIKQLDVEKETRSYYTNTEVRLPDEPGACDFNTIKFTVKVTDEYSREVVTAFNNQDYVDEHVKASDDTVIAITAGATADTFVVTAQPIATNDALKTSKITVSVGAKKYIYTVNVINIGSTKVSLAKDPGVVACLENTKGLGNTDNYGVNADTAITVAYHVVDVWKYNNMYVFGDNTQLDILNYSEINGKTSAQLNTWMNEKQVADGTTPGAYYFVEVNINNKLSTVADAKVVTDAATAHAPAGKYVTVVIRDAFNALAAAGDEFDDAEALAKIKPVTVSVDVRKITWSNAADGTKIVSTIKANAVKTYDRVATDTFKNNDVENYGATLAKLADTYEADMALNANFWTNWLVATGAELKANKYTSAVGKGDNVQFALDGFAVDNDDKLANAVVKNVARTNSRYITNLDVYFSFNDGAGNPLVTYIVLPVNKLIQPVDYNNRDQLGN